MKKIKMAVENDVTFEQGCEEYLVNCKARNLRDGTIKHYKDSMKQMFKLKQLYNDLPDAIKVSLILIK